MEVKQDVLTEPRYGQSDLQYLINTDSLDVLVTYHQEDSSIAVELIDQILATFKSTN